MTTLPPIAVICPMVETIDGVGFEHYLAQQFESIRTQIEPFRAVTYYAVEAMKPRYSQWVDPDRIVSLHGDSLLDIPEVVFLLTFKNTISLQARSRARVLTTDWCGRLQPVRDCPTPEGYFPNDSHIFAKLSTSVMSDFCHFPYG
ncbi:MAG: hypothetical protein ABT940_13575, partial [Alphaproteobacteria bacterium]